MAWAIVSSFSLLAGLELSSTALSLSLTDVPIPRERDIIRGIKM